MGSNPSTEASNSAEQPAEQWTIWPSNEQLEVPKHEQTHTRPLPLPFTIDGSIGGSFCHGQYAGHGNSKVVYRLTNGLILKLCKNRDQEPRLFEQLLALGVYPKVHASGQCSTVSSAGQPAEMWQAWLSDYAKPLDQILKEFPAASKICIPGAIRAMVKAHAGGHILSDNALFNFGMLQGNVVIIDAGSRESSQMKKSEFNKKVMNQFWSKAQTLVQPADLEVYKQQWRDAGWDMRTALEFYENIWQELRSAEQSAPVLDSLEVPTVAMEEPNSTPYACPHVASALYSMDPETLDWLTATYLWGDTQRFGPSSDGWNRRQEDRKYTAAEKLELLISETHFRREGHCINPAEDILQEDALKVVLDAWKADYERWMRPETLETAWGQTWQQWHAFLRRAFRSHLFQFVGSYEMVVFFLVAPFNHDNLQIFRRASEEVAHEEPRAAERNRLLFERSKYYVRLR